MKIERKNVTGDIAFNYIRMRLNQGKTLSCFINELPIETGQVHSFVPDFVDESKLFSFEGGGIYPSIIESRDGVFLSEVRKDSRPVVLSGIHQFLKNEKDNYCLLEDPVSLPSDFLLTSNMAINGTRFFNDEVYYLFNGAQFSMDELTRAFIRCENYIFLCALSSFEVRNIDLIDNTDKISSNFLKTLVRNVSSFIVEAYDHEGYLMWGRK